MADTKISAMPSASTLTGNENVPLVQTGSNVQATTATLVSQVLDVNKVTVSQGGTGAATLTGYVKGNGTSAMTASATVPWADVSSAPYIEVADTTASTALTSTPVLLKPATVVGSATGISYDPTSGEFTFTNAGVYSLSIAINCLASAAGQTVYWYAENNTGAGWVVNTNSGKSFVLPNAQDTQVFAANVTRRSAGQKVRYWIYSNDSKVSMTTTSLGATGAITPAVRIQYGG